MKKELSNGQTKTKTWPPDFVAIGKAYGAGRDSTYKGSIRDAEEKGRGIMDKARDYWNLEQWRDKKIKSCQHCGLSYCSQKCYVCSIIKKVSKGWTSDARPDGLTQQQIKANVLAYHEGKIFKRYKRKVRARDAAKAWRKANPEKAAAITNKYRAMNPDAHRISRQNRRARELLSGGRLSKGISAKLFKLQLGKCACCGLSLRGGFHLDHIMPLALGGSNTDDNIQLLRQRCNQQKHAKHPIDFMQERGFLL